MGSLRAVVIATALGCVLPAAWADDPPAATTPPASQGQQSSHSSSAAPPPLLDLRPPKVQNVMPPGELQAALDTPDDDEDTEPPPEVDVNGQHPAPVVPGGIAAVWWGLTHPTQVWRIFAPVQ